MTHESEYHSERMLLLLILLRIFFFFKLTTHVKSDKVLETFKFSIRIVTLVLTKEKKDLYNMYDKLRCTTFYVSSLWVGKGEQVTLFTTEFFF